MKKISAFKISVTIAALFIFLKASPQSKREMQKLIEDNQLMILHTN